MWFARNYYQRSEEIVRLLLGARADPSKKFGEGGKEQTPLGVACAGCCANIARLLVEARADVDSPSDTIHADRERVTHRFLSPLVLAARSGSVEIVQLLLEAAADAHAAAGRERCEALAVASGTGHVAIARLLIEARADPAKCPVRMGSPPYTLNPKP